MKLVISILLLLFLGFSVPSNELRQSDAYLPYYLEDNLIKPLRSQVDIKLQRTLENKLNQNVKWKIKGTR